jgi:hypothetical protein
MTDLQEKLIPTVRKVMELFRDYIKKEGEDQAHRDTGKMLDTLEIVVNEESGQVTGKLLAEGYSVFVQAGVRADRVNYPIKIMVDWWRRKGLNEKDATRAAFATRANHKKYGIPSKAANAFSKTGKRVGFVSDGIAKALFEAQQLFEKELETIIEFEISEYFRADLRPTFHIEI